MSSRSAPHLNPTESEVFVQRSGPFGRQCQFSAVELAHHPAFHLECSEDRRTKLSANVRPAFAPIQTAKSKPPVCRGGPELNADAAQFSPSHLGQSGAVAAQPVQRNQ